MRSRSALLSGTVTIAYVDTPEGAVAVEATDAEFYESLAAEGVARGELAASRRAVTRDEVSAPEDGRLMPVARPEKNGRPKKEQSKPWALFILLGLCAAAVVQYLSAEEDAPLYKDHSARVSEILPLTELHLIGGNFIGTAEPGWSGLWNPERAQEDCEAILRFLKFDLGGSGTILLMDPSGEPVVECFP